MENIIIVTGATSEIGLSIISCLVEHDFKILAVGRSKLKLNKLKLNYPTISIFNADLTKSNEVKNIFKYIKKMDFKIKGIVNVVGEFELLSFQKISDKKWFHLFDVNVMSFVRIVREAIPILKKSNQEVSIVNISSSFAIRPPHYSPHYSLTKSMLSNLTQSLALELAPLGVRINSLCPNLILKKNNQSSKTLNLNLFPSKRMTTPEDIAGWVQFLISPNSRSMTGQNILIDEGLLLKF